MDVTGRNASFCKTVAALKAFMIFLALFPCQIRLAQVKARTVIASKIESGLAWQQIQNYEYSKSHDSDRRRDARCGEPRPRSNHFHQNPCQRRKHLCRGRLDGLR